MPRQAHPLCSLASYLAGTYTLLVVYVSLHPASGWQIAEAGAAADANILFPLTYLLAGWPRYWTGLDVTINVLGYLPLGLLWYVALRARYACGRAGAARWALLLACCLSLCMETSQSFLPTRVASNLDLAANAGGALLGALLARAGEAWWQPGGCLQHHCRRVLDDTPWAHAGLVLLLLWLLTQLSPHTLLFGNGDLRGLAWLSALSEKFFAHGRASLIAPACVPWLVIALVASNALLIGLLGSGLWRSQYSQRTQCTQGTLTLLWIAAAVLLKSIALAALGSRLDTASLAGLLLGLGLWWMAQRWSLPRQRLLALLILPLCMVLANLLPPSAYPVAQLQPWQQGHFYNFNGLSRMVAAIWPLLALVWLLCRRQRPAVQGACA